jgi:hypothetical protein
LKKLGNINLLALDLGEEVLLIIWTLGWPAEFDKKAGNFMPLIDFGVTVSLSFNFITLLVLGNIGLGS